MLGPELPVHSMVPALLLLAGSAILGTFILRQLLRSTLTSIEQVLWGITVGWVFSTGAIYLIARWQGRLTRITVVGTTVVIFTLAIAFVIREFARRSLSWTWPAHFNGLILLLCLFTPVYWILFSSHFFARGPNGFFSGGSAAADLNFHAAMSSAFLYGNNYPPSYTPHFGDAMLYPFMPDFQTAVLMATGLSLRNAWMITGLTLALVITGLIYCLAIQMFRNQLTAVVAAILFLLNGGLGFLELIRDWRTSGVGLLQFWNSMQVNYANYADRGLYWPNIISDGFVPQRTLLFGLPIALIVLTVFIFQWRRTEVGNDPLPLLLFAGVLTGLLPWFHVHSFIALGVVSICLFVLRPNRTWLWFWFPALLIASPHAWSLISRVASSEGIVRLQPGWMGHSQAFYPLFLVRNLGVPLLLAIPAWFTVDRVWRSFYLAFVALLTFTLFVVVSPNIFDNGKLIYYWHAVNSIFVANLLVRLSFLYRQAIIATLLGLLCIITGITAVQSESLQSERLFSDDDIAASQFAIEQTDPHSLFLTAPVTNQPMLSLAGRRILRGPTAWLWSHGYEFRDREADVRRIYAGAGDAKELLGYYGVRYVFVGAAERDRLRANVSFLDANFPAIYRNSSVAIYDTGLSVPSVNAQSRELAKLVDYDPFALLIEFRRTSFFVYRSWLVARGSMPTKDEFRDAMKLLGRNLFIGNEGWEKQLENNQVEFAQQLADVEGKSNSEYVRTLLANAHLTQDFMQKQLVSDLEARRETRASVLLRLIQDPALLKREYNTAFVLVHYFGYLNRNPSDQPDKDLQGLNHWRKILDESGDYRSISRAFLESAEYQKR